MADSRSLLFYEDILYVYENWRDGTQDSQSQAALRTWASESAANEKEFFKSMVGKATEYMEKTQNSEDDKVVAYEKRSIAELKIELNDVISEALAAHPQMSIMT